MKMTVSSVPTTSEEFSALPQNDLSKPENTCAMFPRPIKLRQKGDFWYLWEYSGILSGIRIPSEVDA